MISVRREAEGAIFDVTVQPRSSRKGLERGAGGVLRVRLTAPPAEGAANRQCVEVLAKFLGVPKSAVKIVSGAASRRKRICILGAEPEDIEAALASL